MGDDKVKDLAERLGLRPIGAPREPRLPVDPELFGQALHAHENEFKEILRKVIKKEIDRDESKRLRHQVNERVKVTYFGLLKSKDKNATPDR